MGSFPETLIGLVLLGNVCPFSKFQIWSFCVCGVGYVLLPFSSSLVSLFRGHVAFLKFTLTGPPQCKTNNSFH